MKNITLVMLTDNALLIGDTGTDSDQLLNRDSLETSTRLYTPAHVILHRDANGGVGFLLKPWVPHELLEHTRMIVASDKIVGVMVPSAAMIRFYELWVKTEREKLEMFGKEYASQIDDISVFYTNQHNQLTQAFRHKQHLVKNPLMVSEGILDLFASNNDWGDPHITH